MSIISVQCVQVCFAYVVQFKSGCFYHTLLVCFIWICSYQIDLSTWLIRHIQPTFSDHVVIVHGQQLLFSCRPAVLVLQVVNWKLSLLVINWRLSSTGMLSELYFIIIFTSEFCWNDQSYQVSLKDVFRILVQCLFRVASVFRTWNMFVRFSRLQQLPSCR